MKKPIDILAIWREGNRVYVVCSGYTEQKDTGLTVTIQDIKLSWEVE